ncbi:MAG TPA: Crp/Fnr family transcriptional regulator [Ohtaekwangia sp.]|nr:Crp/Fnr family transcriptional regulator [Ohtaekwangia sp.]
MYTDLILKNIAKHIALDKEEERFFVSLLESQSLRRKQLYQKQGTICKYSTFVNDGALKSFTVDEEGKEHILSFAIKDWWISDLYSLIAQKPGLLNIEAIADSEVLMLSRENQQVLYRKIPKFERFFRILVENSLVANQQRLIDNMSATAEDRYLHFIAKYPTVPSCVPQHSIASYLGITPEFLSKIRGRLAKGKKHA